MFYATQPINTSLKVHSLMAIFFLNDTHTIKENIVELYPVRISCILLSFNVRYIFMLPFFCYKSYSKVAV